MKLKRARTLEAWLSGLIAAYQNRQLKPRDRRYSSLTHLRQPTQMYGINMKHGANILAAIIVTHMQHAENGICRAVRLDSIADLADFADTADAYFGTQDLQHDDPLPEQYLFPKIGIAELALISLANYIRDISSQVPIPTGTFRAGSRLALPVPPSGALWLVTYRPPLPDHRAVLLDLERPSRRGSKPPPTQAALASPPAKEHPMAYAAYAEPKLWFGQPPFLSTKDRILGHPRILSESERLLHHEPIAGVETFAYSSGLILVETSDPEKARWVINQVFGVLTRSGVMSFAVPRFELITISEFDHVTGAIRSSSSVVTPRNSFLGAPLQTQNLTERSASLPEETVIPLLRFADIAAQDQNSAQRSLRLLNAVTLFRRGIYTEAFVTAWTLIETYLQRKFEEYWLSHGRSRRAVRNMDWTASQQIDLLLAVGELSPTLAKKIHGLRKRRNIVVHKLEDASDNEVEACLDVAMVLNPLPTFPTTLEPQTVFI